MKFFIRDNALYVYNPDDGYPRERVEHLPAEYMLLVDVLGAVQAYFSGGQSYTTSPLANEVFSHVEWSEARHTAGLIKMVDKALARELETG